MINLDDWLQPRLKKSETSPIYLSCCYETTFK